jgi:8-oxo-dGTP pyrophosphatase MutT (NUDIX family)
LRMTKGVDYTGVSVVYFCHDGKDKFVMAKRSANTRDEKGKWDIGGGGLEFNDSVEDTLRKEIKEEYSADVLAQEFLGFRDVHREHAGIKTHWIALDFKVLVDPAKTKNGEPHKFDEIGWFTIDTMPADVHSQVPNFIKKYKQKLY